VRLVGYLIRNGFLLLSGEVMYSTFSALCIRWTWGVSISLRPRYPIRWNTVLDPESV